MYGKRKYSKQPTCLQSVCLRYKLSERSNWQSANKANKWQRATTKFLLVRKTTNTTCRRLYSQRYWRRLLSLYGSCVERTPDRPTVLGIIYLKSKSILASQPIDQRQVIELFIGCAHPAIISLPYTDFTWSDSAKSKIMLLSMLDDRPKHALTSLIADGSRYRLLLT
jgi:hypothetical protein